MLTRVGLLAIVICGLYVLGVGADTLAFTDSGQSLGAESTSVLAVGDLDGDGDLDAFVGNTEAVPDQVWLNDGAAVFADTGQRLGNYYTHGLALGDLDGDGDLDAFGASDAWHTSIVWLNDGAGNFAVGQVLSGTRSRGVALGDLDGDGDLDAFQVQSFTGGLPNLVWLNDGAGHMVNSGQSLGSSHSLDVALGDVDGDGDLDAYVTNSGPNNHGPDEVWLNDGSGSFADSGQRIGDYNSREVVLGDLDGDGDLDAFVINSVDGDRVYLNDGTGTFADSGQVLSVAYTNGLALGDLDGDGDLDAFVV